MGRQKTLLALTLVVIGVATCAHLRDDSELPTLNMDARAVDGATERPGSCTGEQQIEKVKGPVPAGATEVVKMTVKADRAVPFWMFEQAVQQRAYEHCCDGVSVLKAVAEPGDTLFHEIEATGWRRQAAAESE